MKHLIYFLSFAVLAGCDSYSQSSPTVEMDPVSQKQFNDYWYAGEAELTSYDLQQARYGEIHAGEAVLVFVTEPFSASKQVKLDNAAAAGNDAVSVLKLNMTKNFLTGIYPYSMMMSSFAPISYDKYPNALKVATSSQEWCGHTFLQLNLSQDDYRLTGYSYFESEGDVEQKLDKVLLEDEVWNKIRINPATLPVGEIDIIPGTFYLRLRHREMKSVKVEAALETVSTSEFGESSHQKYSLTYPDRSMVIYYESAFPYTILGWEETYRSRGSELRTVAKRKKSIMSPYWQKNSNADRALRAELGL
ncbi:MAG: hypothetical protein AAGA85_21925 [Bacteroidota bacterium]